MKFVEPKSSAGRNEPLDVQRLLLQAQLGDEDCFIELFAMYQPLIRKIWQTYYGAEIEMADWKQEAFIILFRVIRAYPEMNRCQFGSYYKHSLINRMLDLCRKRQAGKRIPQHSLSNIGEHLEELVISNGNDSVEEITHCHICLQELVRSCSKFERQVLIMINSGKDTREICLGLQCSRRQVESAINRLRLKTLRILK